MEERSDSLKNHKKAKGDELVFPLMALAFAIYYLYTIMDLSWEAQINGVLIGSTLILLIIIFLIKTAVAVLRGEADLKFKTLITHRSAQFKRFGLLFLAVLYVIVIPWAGFTLTTFAFLLTAMILLGVRSPLRLLTISLVLAITGYYFFISLLDTRFPPGPIERLIEWLL